MNLKQIEHVHQVSIRRKGNLLFVQSASPSVWGEVEKWGYNASGEWVRTGTQQAIISHETNQALAELQANKGKSGKLVDDLSQVYQNITFQSGFADLNAIFRIA